MPKGKFSFKGNSAQARANAPGQIKKAAAPAEVSTSVTRKAAVPVARPAVVPRAAGAFSPMSRQARPAAVAPVVETRKTTAVVGPAVQPKRTQPTSTSKTRKK